MKFSGLKRINVTAPVVVFLAAVVNAAAASTHGAMPEHFAHTPSTADLAWAVRGGATHAAQTTRVLLARKAASDIRSLDRVDAVCAPLAAVAFVAIAAEGSERTAAAIQHTDSTHQHSAP